MEGSAISDIETFTIIDYQFFLNEAVVQCKKLIPKLRETAKG